MTAPEIIDGATVLYWTRIDHRHRPTANCRHFVKGELLGPANRLAVAQYPNDSQFYLFYCDEQWNVLTDTVGESLARVFDQAEFEYENTSNTWREMP